MKDELVTGLVYSKSYRGVWIVYQYLYPEIIRNIEHEDYLGILKGIKGKRVTRVGLFHYLQNRNNESS